MANITFTEASGLQDTIFGKSQAPIRMFIESRGESFEQQSLIKELFSMEKSTHWGEKFTSMTAMEGFQPVGELGSHPIDGMQEGFSKFLENMTWKNSFAISREMVEDAKLMDLRKLFPEEYIHIESPAEERTLQIDRTQIEQVLINLIKNAREACAKCEHPLIEVKVLSAQSWQCRITVSDNGEGILPEVLDKVFVPFFTTKSGGQGIGLSLCKQIMNRHGGNITVQSAVGQGSCFTLLFG